MNFRYVLLCLTALFTPGCVLQAHLTPAIANIESDVNLGSSQSGFSAVFKANNTPLFGIYDENTTAAVLTGICKPGNLVVILGAYGVTQKSSVFCPENGIWSIDFDMGDLAGYSSSDSMQPITAGTRGTSNVSVDIRFTYSPTTIPAAGAVSSVSNQNGKDFLFLSVGGNTSNGGFSQAISHIGLTQKAQYQYRLEVYRSGAALLSLGVKDSMKDAIELPVSYTWQNGDTVKVTPFDSSGDKSSISIAIPNPAGVGI
ncbi:hypothetical protein ACES2I_11115 [Bdellovibrio bacteriovorus]|uniref:hypothetical protein n=1 Tax=Bdellovibrio bacteriovorus TaxID=959 RepID=UPI0035A63CA1